MQTCSVTLFVMFGMSPPIRRTALGDTNTGSIAALAPSGAASGGASAIGPYAALGLASATRSPADASSTSTNADVTTPLDRLPAGINVEDDSPWSLMRSERGIAIARP